MIKAFFSGLRGRGRYQYQHHAAMMSGLKVRRILLGRGI